MRQAFCNDMSPPPRISIVIPVRNGADFLREAIDSALAQTWPEREVLVINDGSTDNGATEAIAHSYGERIRYFRKPHGGVASALNLGIREMRGEFFSWLSHDDVYLPHKLASQMAIVETLPAARRKELFLFSAYRAVDSGLRPLYTFRADRALCERAPLYAVFRHMINGCTTLVSRALLERAGGFRDLPTTQDYDLWFRLLRMTRPVYHDEVVLLSRLHPGQGFRTRAAREEAARTFIRLMADLTDEEILSCERDRQTFFANVGKGFCEIDLRAAHDFAWSQASVAARVRHRLSPRRNLKLLLHHAGLLSRWRAWRQRLGAA